MPIETPEELRDHIELAIQIELSTIPPYLFAMYSIEDQGSEAALLLKSIVAEEMLHAALATNLLLATGGTPDFGSTAYIPTYPSALPHHDPPLHIELAPCTIDLISQVFMRIEQPEAHYAPPQPDEFETLGQFYHALEVGLREVSSSGPLFSEPQVTAQMSDPSFYRPVQFDAEESGGLMPIEDLDSAIDAIEIIIHQGEGLSDEKWADAGHQELTHYYKLARIAEGTSRLGSVRPLRHNPRSAAYPAEIRLVSDLFNAGYRYLFLVLGDLFSPGGDKGAHVGRLYRLMSEVLSPLALFLVRQPLGDGGYAGPTFEIFEFETGQPHSELIELAKRARIIQDGLAPVVATIETSLG